MTAIPNSLAARDIASLIHPYTNLEKHKVDGPLVIARGDGVYVYDETGKRYLEGMAGLWSTSLGFSEKRLVEAARRQMEQLPTYHMFNSRSTEPSIEAAEELLKIVPKGLGKVLFANSGSEANDQAAKIVWFYNNALGRPRKKRIIGRVRGYHGITVFSGSMTGLPANHAEWDLPVGGVLRTDCPSHYLYGRPGESEAQFVDRLVANLEDMIVREGPDTIGAFIAEPVNGAGGVIVPPADYFPRIQQVLRRYDVLMIADEVICGFGRTGEMFGCDTFGIEPDIMTVAKALSSAYMPISATVISDTIMTSIWRPVAGSPMKSPWCVACAVRRTATLSSSAIMSSIFILTPASPADTRLTACFKLSVPGATDGQLCGTKSCATSLSTASTFPLTKISSMNRRTTTLCSSFAIGASPSRPIVPRIRRAPCSGCGRPQQTPC